MVHKKQILFENDELIIVDKPEDIVVHGESGDSRTLLEQVKTYLGTRDDVKVSFLAPVHRLDRNTKGPVVFSKTRKTAGQLRRLFSRCQVTKIYHARLTGILDTPVFVEADIIQGSHTRSTIQNLVCTYDNFPDKDDWFYSRDSDSETLSATIIKPIRSEGETTLVEIHPWTGRKHQIRVICQEIGHHIHGDKKYNRIPKQYKRSIKRTAGPFTIPALICYQLTIPALNISVKTRFKLDSLPHK